MERRSFIQCGFGAMLGLAVQAGAAAKLIKIVEYTSSGERKGVSSVEKVQKTDAEWHAQLTPEQYEVTRRAGTERAFTGKYWNNHERGLYRCICCENALFSSDTKFESGTGWPSFTEPKVAAAVETRPDNSWGMNRTEVVCRNCGGHLGHLFDDGPRDQGGMRYCINSCALDLDTGQH